MAGERGRSMEGYRARSSSEWSWTPPLQALGYHFRVATNERALTRYLEQLLSPFVVGNEAPSHYRLERRTTSRGEQWELSLDGHQVTVDRRGATVVASLLWHINLKVVESSPHLVRLHAAAASQRGRAVILAGQMEAGKSTLVAGLVQGGLDYLSDEIAAIEPASLRLRGYPKAISLDPGSWPALPELEPIPEPRVRSLLPSQWNVPAESIRRGSVTREAAPTVVVSMRYEFGTATRLEPLAGADAVLALAESTFEFDKQPRRDLDVLARLVRTCVCYRLVVGNLDEACDRVALALDSAGAR